jgi:hypothetical protein
MPVAMRSASAALDADGLEQALQDGQLGRVDLVVRLVEQVAQVQARLRVGDAARQEGLGAVVTVLSLSAARKVDIRASASGTAHGSLSAVGLPDLRRPP